MNQCILCGLSGVLLYGNQPDRVHGHPGRWDTFRCPKCGLYWIYPQPAPSALKILYTDYHTHIQTSQSRPSFFQGLMMLWVVRRRLFRRHWIHRLFFPSDNSIGFFPPFVKALGQYLSAYLGLPDKQRTVLDVGSGNGWFVRLLSDLGWDAWGVEPDQQASDWARQTAQVRVITGELSLAEFDEKSFDVITLRHVIEHLSNPKEVLRTCHALLKPGGRLILLSPNTASLGHRVFQEVWRGLEVPRHVFLYNPENLALLVTQSASFTIETVRTENVNAWWFYLSSIPTPLSIWSRCMAGYNALWFTATERRLLHADANVGEEIVMIARKSPGNDIDTSDYDSSTADLP